MITLKNRLNQTVLTLVFDEGTDVFIECKITARGTLEVNDKLSPLTESQITNGILKQVGDIKKGVK